MGYGSHGQQGGAQSAAPPVAQGLLQESGSIVGYLSEIETRIMKLGEVLFGPEPREAGTNPPSPVPTVRRNVEDAHTWIGRIHEALTRIENRL